MATRLSRIQRLIEEARALYEERYQGNFSASRLHRIFLFWVLVWKGFVRNRCPVRASALAYGTLLALIPMLAVVASVTSTFLKKEGEDRIDQFIVRMVASLTPADLHETNVVRGLPPGRFFSPIPTDLDEDADQAESSPPPTNAISAGQDGAGTNQAVLPTFALQPEAIRARKTISRSINQFIQNTRAGAVGVTGTVMLIFIAISMLSRIENTFNDIWGVMRGRSWFMRVILYWAVITLVPLLLVVALGLASGPHVEQTREFVSAMPFIGSLVFRVLPLVVLCLTFAGFYMLIPNTRVRWSAALAGGIGAGVLFHLNNLLSVFYVSRVVSNSRIYGSLGLVPVFMIGLYFCWVIVLLGAQIAYTFQNRIAYLEEKQIENVNQRGREFVAMRLMTFLGLRFELGEPPPGVVQMGQELGVPTRLVRQVLQPLLAARLVLETAGSDQGYVPARPLATITCHDILLALRATNGGELATRDEPTRREVYGEFTRIQEAERQAASAVNLQALVLRSQNQLQGGEAKALEAPPSI